MNSIASKKIKKTFELCNNNYHPIISLQKTIPEEYLDENTVYHMQPSGEFVIGGPKVNSAADSL